MKTRKQQLLFILSFLLIFSCSRDADLTSSSDDDDDDDDSVTTFDTYENVTTHDATADYSWDSDDVNTIALNGASISVSGSGATADGSTVTITSAGNYSISGTLSDGQIIVDTDDSTIVRLILNGTDINCSSNAPIYIEDAEKAMIVLSDGTQNTISDGTSYSADEEDANAAIFSKQDLTIYGDGELTVSGNYNDGITSKDGLIIASGTITVDAVDDGIRGKDYLKIKSGTITVTAGGDGLKSDNDEDAGTGYIDIEDGNIDVTADGDAFQAEQDILIFLGNINLESGGGNTQNVSTGSSAKGLKSGISTIIYGGTIDIDAADDAIHTDGVLQIYDGTFTIASGDDAIHADDDAEFVECDITISTSYEGIESAMGDITIAGGYFDITSSDDGINVSAGGTSSGRPGSSTSTSGDYELAISDGYIVIDCEGDGLDSNDAISITGGTQLVNGPVSNSNGAIDFDGSFDMDAGFLVAVGSSQMSEAPESSSSQYAFLINFRSQLSSGVIVHVEDADGNDIVTYEPHKAYQSLVFSSDDLKNGSTYTVYTGGSASGTATDGLYDLESYSGGTKVTEFTISSKITTIKL